MSTFGSEPPRWGYSQSPLLYKNLLIVAPMSGFAGLGGLDRATGKVVWKSEPLGGGSYVSPILCTISGVEAVLMLTKGQLTAIDPGSGETIWKYNGYFNKIPIPSITSIGDGRIFVTGGYGAGSVMIKVTPNGEHFEVSELFRMEKSRFSASPRALIQELSLCKL